MANALHERYSELLMDRIRADRYPSVNQMNLLEQIATPRVLAEYTLHLFERIEADISSRPPPRPESDATCASTPATPSKADAICSKRTSTLRGSTSRSWSPGPPRTRSCRGTLRAALRELEAAPVSDRLRLPAPRRQHNPLRGAKITIWCDAGSRPPSLGWIS
jgi:hypothetical protein